MRRIHLALCLIVTALVAASPATAQHKKEKHPEMGVISLERPRKYEPIPVQPGEKWIRLFWKEKAPDPKGKKADHNRFLPELRHLEGGPDAIGGKRKAERADQDPGQMPGMTSRQFKQAWQGCAAEDHAKTGPAEKGGDGKRIPAGVGSTGENPAGKAKVTSGPIPSGRA